MTVGVSLALLAAATAALFHALRMRGGPPTVQQLLQLRPWLERADGERIDLDVILHISEHAIEASASLPDGSTLYVEDVDRLHYRTAAGAHVVMARDVPIGGQSVRSPEGTTARPPVPAAGM